MIKPVLKYIGTLAAGCIVGVVVAAQWTGQVDLDKTLSYVNQLEVMIETHAGNADALLEQLKAQQEIYKNDAKVYYEAVKEANSQTEKANKEIEKANDAAAKLELEVKNILEAAKKEHGMVNIVPPLVNNPDVNHPDGEHDNGSDGVVTPPVNPNPKPDQCTNNSHHDGNHNHSNGKDCDGNKIN